MLELKGFGVILKDLIGIERDFCYTLFELNQNIKNFTLKRIKRYICRVLFLSCVTPAAIFTSRANIFFTFLILTSRP